MGLRLSRHLLDDNAQRDSRSVLAARPGGTFDSLPSDLVTLIFEIKTNVRNNAARLITRIGRGVRVRSFLRRYLTLYRSYWGTRRIVVGEEIRRRLTPGLGSVADLVYPP